jgi:hypothetical protein
VQICRENSYESEVSDFSLLGSFIPIGNVAPSGIHASQDVNVIVETMESQHAFRGRHHVLAHFSVSRERNDPYRTSGMNKAR